MVESDIRSTGVQLSFELGLEGELNGCVTRLTPTQSRVLKLMAIGLSRKEMAETLDISICTARTHIQNLHTQLNTTNGLDTIIEGSKIDRVVLDEVVGSADLDRVKAIETLTPSEKSMLNAFIFNPSGDCKAFGQVFQISPQTVRVHFQHSIEKLGAHTRTEAALRYLAGIYGKNLLRLMSVGFSESEIAHRLGISEETVRNLLDKFRTQLNTSGSIDQVDQVIEHLKSS